MPQRSCELISTDLLVIGGVYGAGGVQTLMNVYGVKPGDVGLIIGSGNWKPIPGSERKINCDFICVAVGLSPARAALLSRM